MVETTAGLYTFACTWCVCTRACADVYVCLFTDARAAERTRVCPPTHRTLQKFASANHCVLLSSRAPTNERHWTARTRDVTRAEKQDGSQCLGKLPHAWQGTVWLCPGSRNLVFVNEFVDCAVALCCVPPSWIFSNEATAPNERWKTHAVFLLSTAGHEGLSCPKDSSIQDPFGWEGLAARFPSKPYPADLWVKMDTATKVEYYRNLFVALIKGAKKNLKWRKREEGVGAWPDIGFPWHDTRR